MFFNHFFHEDNFDYQHFGFQNLQQPNNVNNSEYYELLGVSKDATNDQIRKSYFILAKKHHPDKGGDPAMVF